MNQVTLIIDNRNKLANRRFSACISAVQKYFTDLFSVSTQRTMQVYSVRTIISGPYPYAVPAFIFIFDEPEQPKFARAMVQAICRRHGVGPVAWTEGLTKYL